MDELIELLKEMGADSTAFIEMEGHSDQLQFTINGKLAIITAVHCNDSTAAIDAKVMPLYRLKPSATDAKR